MELVKFDETYIEEYSIELDTSGKNSTQPGPKSPFDDNFADTPDPVVTPAIKVQEETRPHVNPFDEEEEEEEPRFGGGTLSGRDPFDEDSGNSNKVDVREKRFHKKEQLVHRLSSSSEEIVEASIHEDEPIVMAQIPEEEKPKPKPIPAFDNAYDADFDNSPPLHHYSAVPMETDFGETKKMRKEEEEEGVDETDQAAALPAPVIPVIPVLRREQSADEEPKSVRPPRYRKSREIEEPVVVEKTSRFQEVEEETEEKEDIDAIFETYRKESGPIEAKSPTPILTADEYKEPAKQVPAPSLSLLMNLRF
ncbi:hypothetical protein B9Z55_014695 [Caenorhabditis nigoni]|uniref:Uncharacterized protein n=1 Tax=Caenorhabditis nigoni TaxID=1611254 RepID=A0A2G5U6Y0_9PELO|nr:hypothetical protein B9Z55_014695 [Caenorhabditis nigoni]